MKLKAVYMLLGVLSFSNPLFAQIKGGQLHGNFQTDMQYYTEDSLIEAEVPDGKIGLNTYANFNYTVGKFSAGVRYEGYMDAMQKYFSDEARGNNQGFVYKYATYKADELEFTVGNYYEQFGSGMIFRTYEDKTLGYDNAMEGVRVRYKPFKGMYLKGIVGKQRYYFELGPGIVRGIDGELSLNEALEPFKDCKTNITLGGSFVSKFQKDESPFYNLPENVGAYAGRINISRGKISLNSEYAYKINDPSFDNNYIYKSGQGLLVNATYSQKGFGALLTAKRIDNMSFRSDRGENLTDLNINYIPLIAKAHTYSLAAMYPYTTQLNGEAGIQAEVFYKIKKKTLLGGKYGTNLAVNFTRVNAIDKQPIDEITPVGVKGTAGYKSDLFSIGDELFYQDFNVEVSKKFSKKFKGVFTYINQEYNNHVIHSANSPLAGDIHSSIAIADLTYKIKPKQAIRFEGQLLLTKEDYGDWAMALLEYSIAPHWFFTIMDQYNYGNPDADKQLNYYTGGVVYTKGANRFEVTYGKQRAGVICAGGVCRSVPAANGLKLSITSSF